MQKKSRSKAKAARPTTVAAYLDSLTPEKRAVIDEARALVLRHLPEGYAEFMNWGVINWGIPLEELSNTHNRQPLSYVALGGYENAAVRCAARNSPTRRALGRVR